MMTRLLTILVPYTFNRNGYYYFSRRVPRDLAEHYHCSRVVVGLRCKAIIAVVNLVKHHIVRAI